MRGRGNPAPRAVAAEGARYDRRPPERGRRRGGAVRPPPPDAARRSRRGGAVRPPPPNPFPGLLADRRHLRRLEGVDLDRHVDRAGVEYLVLEQLQLLVGARRADPPLQLVVPPKRTRRKGHQMWPRRDQRLATRPDRQGGCPSSKRARNASGLLRLVLPVGAAGRVDPNARPKPPPTRLPRWGWCRRHADRREHHLSRPGCTPPQRVRQRGGLL